MNLRNWQTANYGPPDNRRLKFSFSSIKCPTGIPGFLSLSRLSAPSIPPAQKSPVQANGFSGQSGHVPPTVAENAPRRPLLPQPSQPQFGGPMLNAPACPAARRSLIPQCRGTGTGGSQEDPKNNKSTDHPSAGIRNMPPESAEAGL